ncbi:NF038120 family PEP-CTERM protein [Massilia aurea]|uniref:NF038120 family PEP-CTERM protein n=1 Tax=Massilia aurea TaxID=373040 RepID=UPI0034617CA7
MTRHARLASPTFSLTFATFCGAAALAAPAQAATIGFESGYGAVAHGESYQESGFSMYFDANRLGADSSSAVGAFVDGSDPWACDMACPVNNASRYYGAFNDSVVWITADDDNPFRMLGLDASFIGHTTELGGYPAVAGLLRAQGFHADGTSSIVTLALDGPSSGGFEFGAYGLGAFSQLAFVEIALFGFVCNLSGNCSPFGTNQGQFAIDNVNLELAEVADVPEPASALLFGLGLAGLAAGARRRRNNHVASA